MLSELERKIRRRLADPLNWLCHAVQWTQDQSEPAVGSQTVAEADLEVHKKCLIIGLPLLSYPHYRYFSEVSFCFGNSCTSFVTTLDSLCEPEENRYLNESSNVFLFFTNVCIFSVSLVYNFFANTK